MEKLIILGARQHAKVLVAIIEEFYSKDLEIVGFLDDDPQLSGKKLVGYHILGKLIDIQRIIREYNITCGTIGISNRYMHLRAELFNQLESLGLVVPSLIHERAYISKLASLGEGVILNPGVVINSYAKVGNNTVIYSNTAIEHETVLSDNVYIGPGVNFSSNARVGQNTFIGAGAIIIPDIVIGSNVIVGTGTVVINDIPDNVTVAGVPGKVIKNSSDSKI